MIKAVIFDVDGVLIDSFEANLKFFQDLMVKAGYRPPTRDEFPRIFPLTMKDAIKQLTNLSSEDEILRIWELGRSREVPYALHLLKMPENASETIQHLSRKYPLGIVTSRVRESVFEAPALSKLQRHFHAVVSFQDTVNHKPHPEPLLLACKRLNTDPHNAVYIGDVENDVRAAKAAGMKAIIYSRHSVKDANAFTDSFSQLPSLIENL